MTQYEQIVTEIRDLKIQGAIHIAESGLQAIYLASQELNKEDLQTFAVGLKNTRSTEPALRNIVDIYLQKISDKTTEEKHSVYSRLANYFEEAENKIIEYGANLIQEGMSIYTHCHSTTVVNILIEAKKRGLNFTVYNTETRPKYQGRLTALDLAKHNIEVIHMVDSAAPYALHKADLFLFGADAVNSSGHVFNKVGTNMFAKLAHEIGVKVFSCAQTLKFNPETIFGHTEHIEVRSDSEVWPEENSPYIKIFNPAFDEVHQEYIDGIISEIGIFSPDNFVEEAERSINSLKV